MPIVVNLDVMMARRKISLTELSQTMSIGKNDLLRLKKGRCETIEFSLLATICRTLECQPGDLLVYMDEQAYKKLTRRG